MSDTNVDTAVVLGILREMRYGGGATPPTFLSAVTDEQLDKMHSYEAGKKSTPSPPIHWTLLF